MSNTTAKEFLKEAEEELYTALKALQDGDLPFARSSAMRAASRVTDAHQAERRGNVSEPTGNDVIIERASPIRKPEPARDGMQSMIRQLAQIDDE